MGKGQIGFKAPIATDNGKPISGWVRMWFVPDKPMASMEYAGTSYNTATYPPNDLNDKRYRLTVREGIFSAPRLIPREEWQFAREADGKVVADANSVWLKGGLKPGMTYEVAFESKNPPVAGLGFAAVRDAASALKYNKDSIAPAKYAYMYGASQTGRAIRHIVYEGFTIDEKERKAFDAAFVQTGATGRGSFNERFAQPNELGSFTQSKLPVLYKTTTDPLTGKQDGLGARIPAGLEPKLFLVDTSSEYWDRGRVAALRHVSIDGSEDVNDAPNVRVYHLAGTQHGSGSFPPAEGNGQFRTTSNDYRWAQRALLAALDGWVRQNTEPPPSRHPRLADKTLVAHRDFTFPAIPGVSGRCSRRAVIVPTCPGRIRRCRSCCRRWTPTATRRPASACRNRPCRWRRTPAGSSGTRASARRRRCWRWPAPIFRSRRPAPIGRRARIRVSRWRNAMPPGTRIWRKSRHMRSSSPASVSSSNRMSRPSSSRPAGTGIG